MFIGACGVHVYVFAVGVGGVSPFSHLTAGERVSVEGVSRPLDASVVLSVRGASPAPPLPLGGMPGP